jgi:glycosyltransferase involved in cell wall biosynthesis
MARILFLMSYFQRLGGAERVVTRLATAMAAKHDVHVCALSADEGFDPGAFAFPVHIAPKRRRLPLPIRWLTYRSEARWLRSLKRSLSTDICISSLWRADLINVLSGGHDRKVSILHAGVRGGKANAMLERLRWVAAPIYRAFDRVVGVSSEVGKEAIGLYGLAGDRVVTIPNAFEPDLPPESADKSDVIWCGRFVDEKNPQGAVEIFSELLREEPDLIIAMVGDGPLLAECEEAAGPLASKKLQPGRIAFLGAVPNAAPLIGSARLLVSTSRAESFGLVLLEAMSQGVPVVAADAVSGGPHEVLAAQTAHDPERCSPERTSAGYLLPVPVPGTATAELWVETIREVLMNPVLVSDLRQGALRRAADLSPAQVDRRWDALLGELI